MSLFNNKLQKVQMAMLADDVQQKFNSTDATLAQIAYNLDSSFPRLTVETNDYNRITRAIAQIPEGTTLLLPSETLDLGGNIITINRSINVQGQKKPYWNGTNFTNGTILNNGGILFYASNIKVSNIALYCPSIPNGFEATPDMPINDIEIINCATASRDHGYLFQSYRGLVKDIIVEKCQAYKSVHGFVSKASNIKFINCLTDGCSTDGFVIVSDNIPSATQQGLALNNRIINCIARNSSVCGFSAYARDYFSSNNANNVDLYDLVISNCYADGCGTAYVIGDMNGSPPSGQTFIEVHEIKLISCSEKNSTNYGITTGWAHDILIDSFSGSGNITATYLTKRVKFSNMLPTGNVAVGNWSTIKTLPTGATPTIDGLANYYQTSNTSSTVITNILGGRDGDTITVYFNENNSILVNSANITLVSNQIKGKGSYIVLKLQGSVWKELYSFHAPFGVYSRDLVSDGSYLFVDSYSLFDVKGTGTTANTIKIQSGGKLNQTSEIITFVVRSTSGSFTYGGFDPTLFTVPSSFPLTLNFGTAHISSWVYFTPTGKWICINDYTSPY